MRILCLRGRSPGRTGETGGKLGIAWRGVGPSGADAYGSSIVGVVVCNACHAAGRGNDYVRSEVLHLGAL